MKLMTMYQQDSDFVHWVLGGDPFYHSVYNNDMVQQDAGDIYHHTYYFRGHSHTDTQSSQIENDEVIARTLQEEFSHLAVAEASEFSHAGEEQSQASCEPHDWLTPSTTDYCYSGGWKVFLHIYFIYGIYLLIIVQNVFCHNVQAMNMARMNPMIWCYIVHALVLAPVIQRIILAHWS